jgi:hypothetical protein
MEKVCFLCDESCGGDPRQKDDQGRYAHIACVRLMAGGGLYTSWLYTPSTHSAWNRLVYPRERTTLENLSRVCILESDGQSLRDCF